MEASGSTNPTTPVMNENAVSANEVGECLQCTASCLFCAAVASHSSPVCAAACGCYSVGLATRVKIADEKLKDSLGWPWPFMYWPGIPLAIYCGLEDDKKKS